MSPYTHYGVTEWNDDDDDDFGAASRVAGMALRCERCISDDGNTTEYEGHDDDRRLWKVLMLVAASVSPEVKRKRGDDRPATSTATATDRITT